MLRVLFSASCRKRTYVSHTFCGASALCFHSRVRNPMNPADGCWSADHAPCFSVFFEDADYLVVQKPHDVRMMKDPNALYSLEAWLEKEFPSRSKQWFCHNLDFATSGLLCCAQHKKAASWAQKNFEGRSIRKEYYAMLHGHVNEDYLLIDVPIGPDESDPRGFRMKTFADCSSAESMGSRRRGGPQPSSTEMTVLQRGHFEGKPVSLVLFNLLSGRKHQLRVHSFHIGHPIVGDASYGGDTESFRMMLHSACLSFPMRCLGRRSQPADATCWYYWKTGNPFRELVSDTL